MLLRGLATGAAGATLAAWAGRSALAAAEHPGKLAALPGVASKVLGAVSMEKATSYEDATSYNNFYEFGTDKSDPARNANTLKTDPWSVSVEGLVKKPGKFSLDELLKLSAQEDRIYRLLLFFSGLLVFSSTVTSFSTFFAADDLPLLVAAPVPTGRLYLARLVETWVQSSWMMLVFALPMMAAVGPVLAVLPLSSSAMLCTMAEIMVSIM